MKLLAIESSGQPAGCAFVEDGKLISEYYINSKLTHSKTLLPMIEDMAKCAGICLSEIDAVAVSKGPGSFTGLRIGAATAKGLTLALGKPVVPVSSLAGLSENVFAPGFLLCPVMDARRGEVYCAVYSKGGAEKEMPEALLPDAAMEIGEYLEKVGILSETTGRKCIFLGDGVPVHELKIREILGEKCLFAPMAMNRQRASSIAVLGEQLYRGGMTVSSDDFVPAYLRRPLAEKEQEEGILGDAGLRSLRKINRGEFRRTKHPRSGEKDG